MRKKKQIVWFSMIFILNLTVIFSGAEQGKFIRKVTNRSLKDIYSIKEYFPPHLQYATREILVEFNPTLSDYEIAQIIDSISSSHNQTHLDQNIKKTGRNNVYRILIPENSCLEGMIDIFNRNPDVEYAEPNYIGRIQVLDKEPLEYFPKMINPIERKRIKKLPGKSMHEDIEVVPRAGNARRDDDAPKREEMLQKDVHDEANLVLDANNAGHEAVKKSNGILPDSETDKYTKKIQSSDNKSSIRSKAKIYNYRDSEGRLVITNYSLSKTNTKKR